MVQTKGQKNLSKYLLAAEASHVYQETEQIEGQHQL